ncbi:hypothetical protein AAVH_14200 [Aphelenchoides avenae]|nr:hypothetical protein AAVH_14200 [Aphelenchus avenae]
MTEDNWKLLMKSGALAHYQRTYRVEIDDHKMHTDDKCLILIGYKEAANMVLKLLQRPIEEQILDGTPTKPTVTASEETWKLLDEYNALTGFMVDVTARRLSTGQWELTLSGPETAVDRISGWLQHMPRELELQEVTSTWLVGQGPSGARIDVISLSSDKRSALLTGSPSDIDAAVATINGARCETRRVLKIVGRWLCVKGKGSNTARSVELNKKFDADISMGSFIEGDNIQMVDLTVVAERSENVEHVFAHLDGLHKEYFEIERATALWFTNKRKGAEDARAREFDVEFDSFLNFTSDPRVDGDSNIIGVEILGENADSVRAYRRTIGKRLKATVVEKVKVTKLQLEFWYGHDREETRDRPLHRLEDSTDTKFLRDNEAGLLTAAGRPQGVNEVVERINNTRHIKLFVSKVSLAMSNYIASIRHDYEKDGVLQIHLACMRVSGFVDFRRLHRMNSEADDNEALTDDNDLMHLHEIVLEVPAWAHFIVKDCPELEKTTATGIGFSNDTVKGRLLVDIGGSRSTVERGMEEVLGRITNHRQYKEGDICLRRIKGQPVDIAGFKKTRNAKPTDA